MEYYSDSDNDLDKLVDNAAEEDDDGYAGVSEAEEDNSAAGTGTVADAPPEVKPPKVKREVKNPQPKLNFQAIQGPKGLMALNNLCKNHKFLGNGHEKEDLANTLKLLEQWSFRLFPKFHFEDSLKRMEALGKKREVQVYLRKIRNDMVDNDQVDEEQEIEDVEMAEEVPAQQQQQAEDLFDALLSQQIASSNQQPSSSNFQQMSQPVSSSPQQLTNLSDEQKQRMEQNRKLALERRLLKQSQMETVSQS